MEAQRFARAERLREEGAFAAADTLYRQILDRNPVHLAALRGRARTAAALGAVAEARSVTGHADDREATDLCAVADQCYGRSLYEQALECYEKAVKLAPGRSDAVWGLAECHAAQDDNDQAIIWYRRYLELEPDEPEALHMLAALGDRPPPRRAGDDYVAGLFDRFAGEFDEQLVKELHYQVPQLLFAALEPIIGEASGDLAVLDLGCGTGLSGQLLRHHASRLDGVDLSGGMLREARARGVYDTLTESEITGHLTHSDIHYDVVTAGDVLGYFGALSAVFRGVARIMGEGSLFAFSVEAHEGRGYRLTESGRYVHSRRYIQLLTGAAGLRAVSLTDETLRHEYGEPVTGDIWVLEKPV
ncbi:MAG: tetratricopeptide repeat protein [Rhodospirillaceae bacterium]|jgi:predicted TPR repeat methyltransferase|nr:tetratricopeptide repeat protein [Rhodospirillaceae bacterium]